MKIYLSASDLNYLFLKSQKKGFSRKVNSAYRNFKRLIGRIIRKLKGDHFSSIQTDQFLITRDEIYLGSFPLANFTKTSRR